jgi:RsiW-degrading membrane proteinase PrsW (M82 family)
MWQGWTNGILGVWLFIAAFLNFAPKDNIWNLLIVGIVAAVVGFAMVKEKPWQGWLTGIVGSWLIIAAFIPALTTQVGNEWNAIISGILLMTGGFAALSETSGTTDTHAHAH